MDAHTISGINGAFSKAGLSRGSTAATIQIAAPNGAGVDFAIDGLAYHKADTNNIAVTAAAQQADLTTCMYLVEIDSTGAVTVKKGEEVLTSELGVQASAQIPGPSSGKIPLGAFKIALSGGTFTAGTTAFNGTGVTDTFYDFIGGIPGRPQVS